MPTPIVLLRKIADQFLATANGLVDFRLAHPELSEADKHSLSLWASQIFNCANALRIKASLGELEGIESNIEAIDQARKKLDDQLKDLNKIGNIIHFAAAVVTLGVALTSGNVSLILSAVDGVTNL